LIGREGGREGGREEGRGTVLGPSQDHAARP
jgi:hypothetical protein